jgi:carboxyl-terminal processing protease
VHSLKSLSKSRWFLLGLMVILLSGCIDEGESRPSKPAPATVVAAADSNAAIRSVTISNELPAKAIEPADVKLAPAEVRRAIGDAAAAIYKGDFKTAALTLNEAGSSDNTKLAELRDVVKSYDVLTAKRDKARSNEYQKQLADLAKIRKSVADGNDVNDLSTVFTVVFAIRELSEPNDKNKILDDPFVKQMIEKSLARAKENEAKGKWDEALTQCYSWLSAFYEDNKDYKDQRDRLREMYYIKESLTDNPCESREDRFSGIKKQMFLQAIKVLDYYHVKILDYDAMGKAAIKRCSILGDVVAKADTFKAPSLKRDPNSIAAWEAALSGLADEFKDSQIPMNKDKFVALFDNVLRLNKTTIDLPDEIVIAFFSEASLSEIDPHTNLIWPWQITEFEKSMTQEFTGIGIEINKTDSKLTVASLLPDTPASASGLDAGDVIEKVDGELTAEMTLQCAVHKITGQAGTAVTLTIRHKSADKSENIAITRAKIVVPTVRGRQRTDAGKWLYFIDEKYKIGLIRITNFAETTNEQVEAAITELEKAGMRGLILDLRYNTGGYLQSAVDICDKFIDEGPIVSTRPRFGKYTSEVATKKKLHRDYPLVILINGGSASASEIVAGALQDPMYKRALLVGTRSYGKGSVQTIFGFSGDKAQLKYTMAYYHLPSGQRVESHYDAEKAGTKNWGIAPDVTVEIKGDEVKGMWEAQRDNDVLTKANHDASAEPLKRHSLQELLDSDPQLNVAVMVVKTELIAGRPQTASKQ